MYPDCPPAVPGTYTAVLESGAGMNEDAKILVVDDDPDVLDMVADFLALNAFCVVTARNGAQARSVMAESPAQLVLIDKRMPGEDGLYLPATSAKTIRRESSCSRQPTASSTAFSASR